MTIHYLSKSDFQLSSSCSKKLIYKKAGYPIANEQNEYMEMLAQGGYIVGKMATLLFPDGIEVTGNTAESIEKTYSYLQQNEVVLFEPAIVSGPKLVRIDILIKQNKTFHLIEVKAKSHDSAESTEKSDLKKYIQDVAYQFLVLQEAYPDHEVRCSLLMPDKAKRCGIDGLAGWFQLQPAKRNDERQLEEKPKMQSPVFHKLEVIFKYEHDPNRKVYIDLLTNEGILEFRDVTTEVNQLQTEIRSRADKLVRILNEGISENDFKLTKGCKTCEFNATNGQKNGLQECWGDLAFNKHHIFDLYYGGSIGHYSKGYYLDELISERKTHLFQIDYERLKNAKGELGARGLRQTIQIQHTRNNTEWKSDDLAAFISTLSYPIHFIDFETYTGAIPFHKGMRPYELIAFQWSCHTIKKPGEAPIHREWLHTTESFPDETVFPNFEFARSLMNHIGNTGTPMMWATHENTVLRTIMDQMDQYQEHDETLREWLFNITSDKNREGRLVDMNKMTQQFYFHPSMKGKTSIKKVLPAIWSHHHYLHEVEHFKAYAPETFLEGIIDPYDTLSVQITDTEWEEEIVAGGTAAMRAYQRIRFDQTLSTLQKKELQSQLSAYCKLDTMAMVIIAHHWGLK